MGFTVFPTSGGESSEPRRSTPRAAPVQSGFSSTPAASNFGRIDISKDVLNGVQLAASAPGYIYDRPLAAINTVGKASPNDKGLIDQAGDTIRSIPVLGDVLSGTAQAVGNTVEGSGRLFPALANSWMMSALNDNRRKSPDEKVDGLSAWFATSHGVAGDLTVGELRELAAKRGFSEQDIADVASGKRSIYDYADRAISDNPITDLAGRLVVDPLNIVGVGAAARIVGGAARILPTGMRTMARIDKVANGMNAIEKATAASRAQKLGTIGGMAALRNGDVAGVTLNTLGRHLAMVSRGSSDFLRSYRKVAIGTTAAQLGLQELAKHDFGDNTPLSPIFERLYEAADTMANDKPLSSGMVFNLWAAVNFPIRDGLSSMWKDTRVHGLGIGVGKATLRTNVLRRVTDIEKFVISELAPGKSISEGRKYLISRFGSEDRLNDHIQHFARAITSESEVLTGLMNQPTTSAGFHAVAENNNRVLDAVARAAIEEGRIDGRAIMEKIRAEYQGARSGNVTNDISGQVARAWDPEDHIRQWNEWADRMEALSLKAGFEKGGNVVIGILDGLMPKEHLMAAKATLKGIANADGTIPKHRMDDFLDMFPALDVDANDPGNFFARLRAPDSGEVNVKAALQRIDRLLKSDDAVSMREYLWGVEQWQAREEKLAARSGSVLDEQGRPDPTRAPDVQGAAVFTPTLRSTVRQQIGATGIDYEDVLASRTDDIRAAENDIGAVLRESGFNAHAATQGVMSVGGRKTTAVAVHMDSRTDTASLQLAGAIASRRAGTERSVIMYSGVDALAAHNLTMNAAHARYDIGKLSSDETNALLEAVTERFDGQYEYNDAAGVLHVLVKDGQEEVAQALTDALKGIVGDARLGMRESPAWFQVIHNDMRSGTRGRVPAGSVSAKSVFAAAAGDLRLTGAERRFSERSIRYAQSLSATKADQRGVLGTVREGITRGPEFSRAGSDGLGADQPRGLGERFDPATGRRGIHPDPEGYGLFHGSSTNKLDNGPMMGDGASADNLYGPGLYSTDTLPVAIKYTSKGAGKAGDNAGRYVYGVEWAGDTPPRELNLEVGSGDVQMPGYEGRPTVNGITRNDGTPQPGSLDHVFMEWIDKQAPDDLRQQIQDSWDLGGTGRDRPDQSGRGLYNYLRNQMADIGWAKEYADEAFEGLNYAIGKHWDVMTHDGGNIIGNQPHRVTIFLDPEMARVKQLRDPIIEGHDASGTQGQVVFLADMDLALDSMTPSLKAFPGEERAALGGMDPVQLEKIKSIEVELRQYDPQYRLKLVPTKGNVGTYYPGQGNTIKDLISASQGTSDLLYHKAWKPAASFWNLLFRPVKTSVLAREAKQALYREMMGRTAHLADDKTIRVKDIDSFLQTANAAARQIRPLGAQTYTRGELLPPSVLADIATGKYARDLTNSTGGIFKGFTKEALEALGGPDDIHKILDRTGSRFFRDLTKRTEGNGRLGKMMLSHYSDLRVKTATPRHYIRTWYHMFRFTMDPRFHIMNHLEADWLGLFKYGWGSTRMTGARKDVSDIATKVHARGPNGAEDLTLDAIASGVLDARHLEGYIGRSFKKERIQSARDVLRTMAHEDPAMVILRREFGGSEDEIIEGLEKMMYDFDTKGVERAFQDEAADIIDEMDMRKMEPLLLRLYDRNRVIYKDAVSTFHGNTNRSNIERLMNSYFLYWPISYQLKATKWLFDVLTKQSVGRKTNLGGAWAIDHLYDEHVERMKNDESYQRLFIDNPALWFTASMLLPITPFESGLGFSRASRYMLASAGIVEDEKFDEDRFTAAMRLFMIGPNYTYELITRLNREGKDKPKPLLVPIESN